MPNDNLPPLEPLQQDVRRRTTKPMAGEASPVALRALEAMQRWRPAEMPGLRISEYDMSTDPWAFSNVLGSVTQRVPDEVASILGFQPDYERIKLNPALTTLYPENQVEQTVAHELQHVIQNRTQDPYNAIEERQLAYPDRPREQEAFDVANQYSAQLGRKGFPAEHDLSDSIFPAIDGLFKAGIKPQPKPTDGSPVKY